MRITELDVATNQVVLQGDHGNTLSIHVEEIEETIELLRRGKTALEFTKGETFPIEKKVGEVVRITSKEMVGPYHGFKCSECGGWPIWKKGEGAAVTLACVHHKHLLEGDNAR